MKRRTTRRKTKQKNTSRKTQGENTKKTKREQKMGDTNRDQALCAKPNPRRRHDSSYQNCKNKTGA